MKSASSSNWQWPVGIGLGVLHSFLVSFTYRHVPEPYMDELFHVDQARRICVLDFSWNEKITTPPALYLLSLFGFCGHERYVNSLLIPFFYVGAVKFRKMFSHIATLETAAIVLLLPVLFHSSLLFYTDLLSITVILWAFSCKSPNYASLFFFIAVLTRQTNIVFAAVYGAVSLVNGIDFSKFVYSLLHGILRLWGLVLLALGFVAFFILNGFTVVLGDHSAHQPRPHFMQLYYFLLFACFSALPCLLFLGIIKESLKEFFVHRLRNVLFLALIVCCIRCFTYEHPYLLADNRHFTFYVWRKWFRRHWLCPFLLAPCYLFAAYLLKLSVRHIQRFILALFLVAFAIVLVPLPLLEPRYFIVPYVMWRLSLKQNEGYVLVLEILYSCFINIFALYLFYEKPFIWESEPNVFQRFMW